MTLLRQVSTQMVSVVFLGFVGMLIATVLHLEGFVSKELNSLAREAAQTLSLSTRLDTQYLTISDAIAENMMATGHYARIQMLAENGHPLISEKRTMEYASKIPKKIQPYLHFTLQTQSNPIIVKGQAIGTVFVTPHSVPAYNMLWRLLLDLTKVYATLALIMIALSLLATQNILSPIHRLTQHAKRMRFRNFPIQHEIPKVSDLKQVVVAFNHMSQRLKIAFDEQSKQIDNLRVQAYTDPITGIGNRRFFEQSLMHYVSEMLPNERLFIVQVHLNHFETYNEAHGFESGNSYLKTIAQSLEEKLKKTTHSIVTRSMGAGFHIILPQCPGFNIPSIVENIEAIVHTLDHKTNMHMEEMLDIRVAGLEQQPDLQTALAALNEKLLYLEDFEKFLQAPTETSDAVLPFSKQKLVELLDFPADVRFDYLDVQLFSEKGNRIFHRECTLTISEEATPYHMRELQKTALSYGLSGQLLKTYISLFIHRKARCPHRICVRLLPESLHDDDFIAWVEECIAHRKFRKIWNKFDFEFEEHNALNHLQNISDFIALHEDCETRFGLRNFGKSAMHIGYLDNIRFHYAKTDISVMSHLEIDQDQQFYLKSMSSILHHLDMLFIADGKHAYSHDFLQQLQFDGWVNFEPDLV